MGELAVIYGIIVLVAVVTQYMLYKDKEATEPGQYILSLVVAVILAWMSFTSLPSNETLMRVATILIGFAALLGVIVSQADKKYKRVGKQMLTLSIALNFILLVI